MPTLEELAQKYTTDTVTLPNNETRSINQQLAEKYGSETITADPIVVAQPETTGIAKRFTAGAKQGFMDVSDTLDLGLQPTVGKALGMEDTGEKRIARRKEFDTNYSDDPVAGLGRIGGEVGTTAPLIPSRVIQGAKFAIGALPTISAATGEAIPAPLTNRLMGSVASGAIQGGAFGAATSAANDDSLIENTAKGVITGAIANPVISAAAKLGGKVLPVLRAGWADLNIQKLSRDAGLPAASVKNIVGRLEDAGLTPQQAQAELNNMGPRATLADLDMALSAEAGGLAQLGGKPTSIVKSRYATRAETANDDLTQFIDRKLGPKPDYTVVRGKPEGAAHDNIIKEAQKLTRPDYNVAHKSTTPLDVSKVISDIDAQLVNAVGAKAKLLKEAKSYLFKDVKDADGNITKVLKNDVGSLHAVRQELDDYIQTSSNPITSAGKNALNSLKDVRAGVDLELKKIPEMKAADEKFAEKMNVARGLQTGYEAITKRTTKEQFDRVYNNAAPEIKEKIEKGVRAAIGDYIELAQRGELQGAQQLFGKKSSNRYILEKVYGTKGTDTLEELTNQAAQRYTEKHVLHQSATALNQAIRSRYSEHPSGGVTSEALKGLAFDVAAGSPGGAAAMMAGRRYLGNRYVQFSENKLGQLAEGSADLISRQGAERDVGISVLDAVKKIQDKLAIANNPKSKLRLPVAFPIAPVAGEAGYKEIKSRF